MKYIITILLVLFSMLGYASNQESEVQEYLDNAELVIERVADKLAIPAEKAYEAIQTSIYIEFYIMLGASIIFLLAIIICYKKLDKDRDNFFWLIVTLVSTIIFIVFLLSVICSIPSVVTPEYYVMKKIFSLF